MSPLGDICIDVCVFLFASSAWSALIAAGALGVHARLHEHWVSYWSAALVLAVLPPFLVLCFWLAPSPIPHFEFDVAANAPQINARLAMAEPAISTPNFWIIGGAIVLVDAYVAGLASGTAQYLRQTARARRIVRMARPLTAPFSRYNAGANAKFLVTDECVTPFCVGGRDGAIVLSRAVLAALTPAQIAMVTAHEAQHLRRRDPLLFAILSWVKILFWHSPFIRALAERVRLAAEISCDAAAAGASAPRRQIYADALVRALEVVSCTSTPAVAFGRAGESARIRLSHLLSHGGATRGRLMSAILMGVVCAGSLSGAALAASTARVAALTQPVFARVLEGRVSQAYGPHGAFGGFHTGVDVAAPIGTIIAAPAEGRVLFAGGNFQGETHWGNVVLLRHAGGWLSFFAHLDAMSVRAGEYVEVGRAIGSVGNTGVSTGPHVHVEMMHNGARVDPRSLGVTP